MPHYLALGVTKSEILHSTLNGLKVYDDAYKLKKEMLDEMAYLSGIYTYEAVTIALANAFRGKGRKPQKYREEPILQSLKPVTEDEFKRKRREFSNKMATLRANFHIVQAEKENAE